MITSGLHVCKFNEQGHCVASLWCYNTDPAKFEKLPRDQWDYPHCQKDDPHCVLLCDCVPRMPWPHRVGLTLALIAMAGWIGLGVWAACR